MTIEVPIARRTDETTIRRLARVCAVLFIANLVARILLAASLPLFYTEAYFWEWSQSPALGYLDYPPLVAWLIRGSTQLLGERSEIAVRLSPLVFGTGSFLLVYRLARQLFDDREIAWRAVLIALCLPVLSAVGFISLPDSPLVFLHLLGLVLFCTAVRGSGLLSWLVVGVVLGLALLSKLVAVLILVAFVVFLLDSPEDRRWLGRKEPYLALAAAGLVFSPFVIWNLSHEWAGFRLQLWQRHLEDFGFDPLKLLEYGGEQLANALFLLGPLVACLFIRTNMFPEPWRNGVRLLRWQAVLPLTLFAAVGAVTETHPHWTGLAYAPAAVLVAVVWKTAPTGFVVRRLGLWIGLSQAAILGVAAILILALPVVSRIDPQSLPRSLGSGLVAGKNRLLGMDGLAAEIEERFAAAGIALSDVGGQDESGAPIRLFGPHFRITSPLAFAWRHGPVIQVSAMATDILKVGDAQRFNLPRESFEGGRGIFFGAPDEVEAPIGFFNVVEELEPIEQRYAGEVISRFRVFSVTGFRPGAEP